ncbi:gamma-aminobutyric acid type B receptor subunit 2-like [Watersipora subatra]|uniref:gamma-aminobutyric acid type B receptor subunit 2-like n=1 Tax=Watersipora subatra TaxID=2589382 RepID=UPI00355B8040
METSLIVFVLGASFCSLGYLLTLAMLVFNIKYMNLRFIKMTSPRVNMVLFGGALALYTGSLLLVLPVDSWSTDAKTRIAQARYWLVTLGFTGVCSSMLVKGWRVHRLFQYPRAHSVTIRDGSLFGGIILLLLLDVGLLTSWQIIDPISCPAAELIDSGCSSEFYSIWLLVLLLYKYVTVFMSCYIGWQIRHITFPALDDSRCLLLSSGVTLTLSGTSCLLFLLFPENTLVLLATAALCIWLGVTATLFLIFLPKIKVVSKSRGLEPLMGSASKYVQQPVSSDVGIELVKILAENRYLKKQLEEREVLVTQLKKKVPGSTSSDSGSQNYSFTSTVSPPTRASSSFCCVLPCFMSPGSNHSMRAAKGSPNAPNDISFSQTVESPTVYQHHLSDRDITSRVLPIVTISHAEPIDIEPSVERAEQHVVGEEQLHSAERISSPVLANSENIYLNDMELLSSIADTYQLGDDIDALSYISSCLNNSKSWSLPRRPSDKSRLSVALGNDQLYPWSAATGSKPKPKKQRRRQSLATTNVYVNDKGHTLII